MVNYCDGVKCENRAVCQPSFRNYTCECLDTSYSGRHCEKVATSRVVRQAVAKSFGYIAITAIVVVAGFIVVMDVLKYGFGIDPVEEERERIRSAKPVKRIKHRPVIKRYTYHNETPRRFLKPITEIDAELSDNQETIV